MEGEEISQKSEGQSHRELVAIIGMSGVMPGSDTPEEFWNNLLENKDLFSEIARERSSLGLGMEADQLGAKYAGLLRDIDKFDAPFFKISDHHLLVSRPLQRSVHHPSLMWCHMQSNHN